MAGHDPFKDLIPKPTADDLYLMGDELKELSQLIRRNDEVVISGGPVIAWWGFVSALAGLWNFSAQIIDLPDLPIFIINGLAGYIGSFVIVRVMGTAKILKQEFQAITAVWTAICLSMPVLVGGMMFRHAAEPVVVSGMQSLMFASAMGVTAMASRKTWLLIPTWAWGVVAVLFFFVVDNFWRPLLFASACLTLLTTPGLLFWVGARRAVR